TERLGIVIPQFEDVVHFIGTTLSGANANELFNNKQGTLDVKKYARFCKDITNHFRDIASGNGFRPITPAMVTQCAIQEALLNVDLRKTHQPFLDLLGELKKAGIPIYREAVAKALDSTLQLDIKTSEYENHLTVAEGENMHVSRIIHETLEYALEHCWEEEMFHPNADELERFVDQALSACTSVEELHSVFVTMNTFVERRIFTVKGKNNTFHQRAEAENGVFTLHKFASLLSEKVLTFQAEWLPSSVTERFALVLACMRSGITFLANEQTVSNLQDFSRTLLSTNLATSKELAEAFLQYGAILNGTHPLYEQYGWKPKSFRPSRLLPYTEEHLDIATITSDTLCKEEITDGYVLWKYIQEYYDLLMDCLERGSMNIEEVVQQFDTLVSSLSSSIDKLPATIARDIYGLGSILTPFFLQQEFNADDFTDQKRALYCSQLFSDTHSAQLLQQVVMERLLQHKSFDERLYWLFTNPITRFSMTKRARTDFVEHEVQTPEQFAAVRKELKRYIDMATDSEYVGAAVILEQAFGKDAQPRELFSMLFDMHRFDVKIKKYIFEKVQQAQNYEDAAENERAIVATDRALMGLAQANDFVRYGVVRELLIGKDGLLHTQRDREWLLDYLFRATAQKGKQTAEQQQTQQVVQELVRAMAQTAPEDMLFFALAPLIHERIMRAPQQTTSWEHILKKYANYTDTTAVEDTLRDAEKIRQQSTTWKQLIQQTYQPHTPSPTPAGVRVNEIQLCRDRVQFIAEQYPLPKESDKQKTEAFTIERFVVKLAESLGSPGVRFLQILGQYIDVPPTLQSAFNDATDSVAGQNKMTAYETIQREWPECEHQILRVLDRIGGGS
ncbi:MAG TPA: hypothetical protein VJB65_05250, partial [Patescibacteria group bacterium]|nr:hypothetical protein [Patescibacteria group bacterium]